jgi:hypothetical protein
VKAVLVVVDIWYCFFFVGEVSFFSSPLQKYPSLAFQIPPPPSKHTHTLLNPMYFSTRLGLLVSLLCSTPLHYASAPHLPPLFSFGSLPSHPFYVSYYSHLPFSSLLSFLHSFSLLDPILDPSVHAHPPSRTLTCTHMHTHAHTCTHMHATHGSTQHHPPRPRPCITPTHLNAYTV